MNVALTTKCAAAEKNQTKKRSKIRVKVGQAFKHWCQLKEAKGLRSPMEVAPFLLHRYIKCLLMFANQRTWKLAGHAKTGGLCGNQWALLCL
uniref:Uncharacterized protein n=1 Tax=Fundulus heteroclitus TaxID=8078 RepID=A0A3Q2QJ86_FUNHE